VAIDKNMICEDFGSTPMISAPILIGGELAKRYNAPNKTMFERPDVGERVGRKDDLYLTWKYMISIPQ
jgi:hypothetical protein